MTCLACKECIRFPRVKLPEWSPFVEPEADLASALAGRDLALEYVSRNKLSHG